MRAIIAILAVAGFLFLSRWEYEMEVEESAATEELMETRRLAEAADSLGLTGEDWVEYVNGED